MGRSAYLSTRMPRFRPQRFGPPWALPIPPRTYRGRDARALPRRASEVDVGSRRTVVLLAAGLIAVVAAVAMFSYLSGVQKRANKGAALVKVFVVKKDIP